MAKHIYTGEEERIFPSLGITVTKGTEFDAPDDFVAFNTKKTTKATSAPTVGE